MFFMYDSVDLDQIPAEPHAVAAYLNGHYANVDAAREKFPHARILTISVAGDVAADCYDVEQGDYTPEDVPRLYQIAHGQGVWRPCFYASLENGMQQVKEQLNRVVTERADIRLWVAYYNGVQDLPAGYDAHQFTDKALGRNLDESICADTFFKPAEKPAPKPEPPADDWWRAEVSVCVNKDAPDHGKWTIKPNGRDASKPV